MNTSPRFRLAALALMLAFPAASHAQSIATRLIPPGLAANSRLGISSRSLAAGGGKVAVGAPYHGTSGAVFIFDEKTGKHLFTLDQAANPNVSLFGWSVAISRHRLIVGAPWSSSLAGAKTGAAFVYDLTTRRQVQFIQGADYDADDEWGYSVAIEGGTLVLGGPYGANFGAVEVWKFGQTARTFRVDSSAIALATGARFGQAIALQNGLLAIGAPGFAGQGSVYLFDAQTNMLINTVIPQPSVVRTPSEEFGASLAFAQDRLAVGAPSAGNPIVGRVDSFGIADPLSLGNFVAVTGYNSAPIGNTVSGNDVAIYTGVPNLDFRGGAVRIDDDFGENYISPIGLGIGASFGASVVMTGNSLFATAPGDDTVATNAGALWKVTSLNRNYARSYLGLVTGQAMPGTGTATLASIKFAVGNSPTLTIGTLAGGDAVGEKTHAAWGYMPSAGLSLLARGGIPASPALRISGITHATVGWDRSQWLRATRAGPGVTASNNQLYRRSYNGVQDDSLATGAATASGRLQTFSGNGRADNAGANLVVPVTYSSAAGITPATAATDSGFVFANAGISGELREGLSNAPGTLSAIGQTSTRFCYRNGRLTTSYFIQGAPPAFNQMVQCGPLVGASLMAQKGSAALNSVGTQISTFSAFLGEANASTHVILRATMATNTLTGVTSANNEGLWTGTVGNNLLLRIRKGDIGDYRDSRLPTISRFIEFGITTQGTVFALVGLSGGGVTAANDMALIAKVPGADVETLLREGDLAPGCEGARIGMISATDFYADGGYYAALASLVVEANGATASNNLVLLKGQLGSVNGSLPAVRRPRLAIRKGFPALLPAGSDSYTSFALPCVVRDASGALDTGLGTSSAGQLLRATLPSGRTCLFSIY